MGVNTFSGGRVHKHQIFNKKRKKENGAKFDIFKILFQEFTDYNAKYLIEKLKGIRVTNIYIYIYLGFLVSDDNLHFLFVFFGIVILTDSFSPESCAIQPFYIFSALRTVGANMKECWKLFKMFLSRDV